MTNLLKADLYRTSKSKSLYVTAIVCIVFVLLSALLYKGIDIVANTLLPGESIMQETPVEGGDIAEMGDIDVRSLVGKLTKVVFASKLHEKPITIDLVNEALRESAGEVQEELQVDDIINCVCDFFKVNRNDILGKKKNKEFVEPRQICIYLITDMMSLPLVTIGQKMGGRDHATVIYARDKIAEQIKSDNRLSVAVEDIRNMLLKK